MATIARKSMGAYLCRCTTCGANWVSADSDGGEEAKKHKH